VAVSLRHISVLDAVTSDICWQRAGLTLPANDVYWFSNLPPLHGHCRSFIQVLLGDVKHSERRPNIPPAAGYGQAPAGFIESLIP
jgi:hypothetical protein